jgi:hypothetical protein
VQGAPPALRAVRTDAPPGEDPPGGMRATAWRHRGHTEALGLSRISPRLEHIPSRHMACQDHDGLPALEPGTHTERRVVLPQPAPTGRGTAAGTLPATARPLGLRRHHRPWPLGAAVEAGGQAPLANMAPPAVSALRGYALGSVCALAGTLPLPADQHSPLCVRSETMT